MANQSLIEMEDIFSSSEGAAEEKVTTLYFKDDPLITVVSLLRHGGSPADAYILISKLGTRQTNNVISLADLRSSCEVNNEDAERANKIRSLFKNRMLLRRLHGQPMSTFMKKVERILDNDKSVDSDCVSVLVTLPRFYDENVMLSGIFKQYRSIPEKRHPLKTPIFFEGPVKFVDKVRHESKHTKYSTYYWATRENYLIAVNVTTGSVSDPVWDFLSRSTNVGIRGELIVSTRAGYDFRLARPIGNSYELYDTRP